LVLTPNFGQNFFMKRALLLIIILVIAGFTAYKLFFSKEEAKEEAKEAPLSVNKNSDVFSTSFSGMMNDYYSLKDALVDWDTTKANKAAMALEESTGKLPMKELKADSMAVETAVNYVQSIQAETKGFRGETSIEQKRRSFNIMTSELYDLVRTVRFDGGIIYHVRCPMAFGDSAEGYWLSKEAAIINPYLGNQHPTYKKKMLGCGEVVDSLDFSKK
jgi:Protein of unknown function (DUF3347)